MVTHRSEDEKHNGRGFAAMDPEVQRAIARKGGEAVSEDRQHMAEIGRRGGEARGHRKTLQSSDPIVEPLPHL